MIGERDGERERDLKNRCPICGDSFLLYHSCIIHKLRYIIKKSELIEGENEMEKSIYITSLILFFKDHQISFPNAVDYLKL